MLEKFQLLRNIGQFDNASALQNTSLAPYSLLYAENGRGKTTIAAILRSLATNDPTLIQERQRLGSINPPHIIIKESNTVYTFEQGIWKNRISDIAIFDDSFVAENICSGIEINSTHRQNLHELIIGAAGVSLSTNLQNLIRKIEAHNTELRRLGAAIPASARGPYDIDAYCEINLDTSIDSNLKEAERRFAAAKSVDAILKRPVFQSFELPVFDEDRINELLGRGLEQVQYSAARRVQSHIHNIGKGGEAWILDGITRIDSISSENENKTCPFCAQDLSGSEIINYYNIYFSENYKSLKEEIINYGIFIRDSHSGDVQTAFERSVRLAVEAHEFWKEFAEIPKIEIDTAAIVRDWNSARDAVLSQLRKKASAPLEQMELSFETKQLIFQYQQRICDVNLVFRSLSDANSHLATIKEQVQEDELSALTNDLERLKAQKMRFEPDIKEKCDRYLSEKNAKIKTETLRYEARLKLENYREKIFREYEDVINDYLMRLNATFRLGNVRSQNNRGGSSAAYSVVINQQSVDPTSKFGPSFRNTLSSGDRNSLALAFFFAKLEKDPQLADKIVVFDDPMTSLDEHRTLRTREEILKISKHVKQVIVLSHSKSFLCRLWEQADKNSRCALRINRSSNGSEIVQWNVENDSLTEHDNRFNLVHSYIQSSDQTIERQVAESLRPILEAFMRVAYPNHFPPGSLLGPFIDKCRRKLGTSEEILSEKDIAELKNILDYANSFHHDSNPAWQTQAINDAELTDFAERALLFTSRR